MNKEAINKRILGRYSKANYSLKPGFYDPPSTSVQDIICIRTNDTSTDLSYPNTRYKSIKNLGDGSASTIFEGWDTQGQRKVIIKKLCKREYWRKELEVLKKLRESETGRILKFLDFYESQRNSFLITEYYPGFDLFEHIDLNVPYSEEHGLQIVLEMAKCIKECHDNNILHLDIKCENYMVKTPNLFTQGKMVGKIVLIDFGHAEIVREGESIEKLRRGYSYGTSYFLCPEGYFERINSSKSDIWSLAICFSLLLTGDYPYLGSKREYYRNSVLGNFYYSRKISNQSAELIQNCLQLNPFDRPNIDQVIKHVELRLKAFGL